MAKRNAKQEILNRRKKTEANKKKDTAERQAGITRELKNKKKTKGNYYSHSKGI